MRVVVVVVSVVVEQPVMKIAASERNVSAIRFFFIMQKKRICPAPRMGQFAACSQGCRQSVIAGVRSWMEGSGNTANYKLKALRYFFCVVFPPVAVLMTGRILSFILSLLLTLLGWVPGVIHACLVVNDYQAEHRH